MFKILKEFINKLMIMTTSYSLNVFESPLSKEEEEYYLNKHLNGDKIARNKLIEHNLRLVAHIVKKYETKNSSVSSDDLISIGTIGLIKGIDSYSINKGVKLTTYAAKCAENEILMFFRSNKKYNSNISLNEIIAHDKDGGNITLSEILESKSETNDSIIEYKDNIEYFKNYLCVLSDRELEIIKMRYGLLNTSEQTQKEIAK